MTAAGLDRPDLRIWIVGGALALALHASFAFRLIHWHDLIPGDDGTEAVLIDLAPLIEAPQSQQDLSPGPEQQEAPPSPGPPKEEPQQQIERIEPLPVLPSAETVLPKAREKPVESRKIEHVRPPAPATTAPPRPHPSSVAASDWHRQIAIQLERHKSYPALALARHETGIASVAFTLDRGGRVLAAHIVRSSQMAALDVEALATVRRAAPFPPPPAGLPGRRFDFVVPIQFQVK